MFAPPSGIVVRRCRRRRRMPWPQRRRCSRFGRAQALVGVRHGMVDVAAHQRALAPAVEQVLRVAPQHPAVLRARIAHDALHCSVLLVRFTQAPQENWKKSSQGFAAQSMADASTPSGTGAVEWATQGGTWGAPGSTGRSTFWAEWQAAKTSAAAKKAPAKKAPAKKATTKTAAGTKKSASAKKTTTAKKTAAKKSGRRAA